MEMNNNTELLEQSYINLNEITNLLKIFLNSSITGAGLVKTGSKEEEHRAILIYRQLNTYATLISIAYDKADETKQRIDSLIESILA